MYVPRLPLIIVTTLAVLFGAGWLTDSIAASRVERSISRDVEEAARLEVSPRVSVGGVPYLASLFTGEIPTISVHALDVDVAELGMVNAQTRLEEVQVTRGQALNGNIDGAPARAFSRTISLDGVALGHLIDMTDLDIAHPYDISPGGGPAAEALLTGTPFNQRESHTVLVDLRLVGDEFRLIPRELVDAPAELSDEEAREVMDAFALTLDTTQLPLAGRATSVNLSGGSIYFESRQLNVTVNLADLSPVDVSG